MSTSKYHPTHRVANRTARPKIEIKVLKRLINETSFVTKDATQVASAITTDTYGGVLICCDGSCLCLNFGNTQLGFTEVGRAFLPFGKAALCCGQLSGFLRCMAGVAGPKPIGRDNKVFQTQIYTNGLVDHGQRFRLETAQAGHEPATGAVTTDGYGGWCAWQIATPLDVKRGLTLCNVELALFVLKGRLGELGALIAAFLFEGWVSKRRLSAIFA